MSAKTSDPPHRKKRSLRDDERVLWRAVTRTIAPLKPTPDLTDAEPAAPASEPVPPGPTPILTKKLVRPKASAPPLAPLDRRAKQRLARGREAIDARLDLHGLTQSEAHDALRHFLRNAQARGAKFALVITGKGAITGGRAERDAFGRDERGVLRRQVPLWLKLPELREIVVGFETASVGHGGEGALYVRLRRRRGVTQD